MADIDEETKENIIAGVQKIFPDVTDSSFFRIIFNSYDWDMETGLQAIKTLLEGRTPLKSDTLDNGAVADNNNDMRTGNSKQRQTSANRIVPLTSSGEESYAGRLGAIPKSSSSSDGSNKKSARNKKREKLVSTYLEVAKLRNPIERIAKYTEAGVKVVVIMRGCPGSGKTYLVQQLAHNLASLVPDALDTVDHHIFSADDFWVNPTLGKYLFNAEYLEYAHLWNQKLVRQASSEGRSPIFVDNTHTRMWEMKAVASIAVEYGYVVEILEPPTRWAFSEAELVKRNSHGVHKEAIRRMLERYEHGIKPKHLLAQYNLNYPPNLEPPQRWTVTFDAPASKAQKKIFNTRFHCASLDLILALKPGPADDAPAPVRKKTAEPVPAVRKEVRQPRCLLDLLSGDNQQLDGSMKTLAQPVLIPDKLTVNKVRDGSKNVPNATTAEETTTFGPAQNDRTPSPADEVHDDETMVKLTSSRPPVENHHSDRSLEAFENINLNESNTRACDEYGNPITNEYVLVKPDGAIAFQKLHDSPPFTHLREFIAKGSSAKIQRNVIESTGNRLAAVFSKLMQPSENENASRRGSNQASDSCGSPTVDRGLASVNAKTDGIWNSPNADVTTSDSRVQNPLATWTENASSDVPSSTRSDSPKEQRFLATRPSLYRANMNDAPCNTNFEDFNNLARANAGLLYGRNIITACADRFKIGTTLPKFDAIKAIATHDKSSMTHSENPVVETDSGVQLLAKMFPNASVECIEELLEKCNNDVDWTASLILDSGLEVSENFVATDDLKFSTKPPNEETPSKMEVDDDPVVRTSSRKPKKNKIAEIEELVKMARELEGNFVLSDDHYSERLRKVRETKFGIQTSSSNQAQNDIDSDDSDDLPREASPAPSFDSQESDDQDDEDKMDLIVSKHFVSQLSDQFGSAPNLYGNELIVKLPVNLARQLYSYALDAISQQMEEEQIAIDQLIKEDEQYARQLQDQCRQDPCNFQEILDHEFALRTHKKEYEQNAKQPTIAGKLSLRLLSERFPTMDPSTLYKVLADTNQSLSEATNLLSLAGHDPVDVPPTSSTTDDSPETYHDADYEMSRAECIRQANAYHEVAEKLNETKKEYYNKARMYHDSGNHAVAQFYSEMFAWYTERIKESNVMAARSMLMGNEKATTLDLHFLNVPDAIRVFDLFIDNCIRRLSTRKREIFIITGRGLHSLNGRSKIKPAIILRLRQRGLKYSEINPGMLKTAITKSSCESYRLLN